MQVQHQLRIIDFLLHSDDRSERVAKSCRENGYENRIGVDGSDQRTRIAMVCMMGWAKREGKETSSQYLTQEEAWHIKDETAGEALADAFRELTEDQWRVIINALADGSGAAKQLAGTWLIALSQVPHRVLANFGETDGQNG